MYEDKNNNDNTKCYNFPFHLTRIPAKTYSQIAIYRHFTMQPNGSNQVSPYIFFLIECPDSLRNASYYGSKMFHMAS